TGYLLLRTADDPVRAGLLWTVNPLLIGVLVAVVIVIPLGYLWPLWHNKRQTWADMVLGSVVLSDR
ncbi:hypothetical protein ACWDAZ_35160, partial [Streptomyces sp. NPDC001215]